MLHPVILDNNNNKKVSNWISTEISTENVKPFDSSFVSITPNLMNGRIILKINNYVLADQNSSSFLATLF